MGSAAAPAAKGPICSLCCDAFNNSTRRLAACPFCEYPCCLDCLKRFLLGITVDPHCMNCKRGFTFDILDTLVTRSFRDGDLKAHRSEVLFDREKSMLPATQAAVEVDNRLEYLQGYLRQVPAIKREMLLLRSGQGLHVTEHRAFVRACPASDCRGFLSTQWKCGLCHVSVCKDCHEVVRTTKEEHACDPEHVESAKAIGRDSKPCPNCAAMIFKIEGCSQMFCTMCLTAFDWNTGQIAVGRIHNPHYYEYQRLHGNNNFDAANRDRAMCDGLVPLSALVRALGRGREHGHELTSLHQRVTHIRAVVMPTYQINNVNINADLRKSYLKNEISERQFKATLQTREKRSNKKTAVLQILDMFHTVCCDLFRRIVEEDLEDANRLRSAIAEFHTIRVYSNEQLSKISTLFNNAKVPRIDERFEIVMAGGGAD